MIHEFTQRAGPVATYMGVPVAAGTTHKIAIDLARVESVQQGDGWTALITSSENYYVTEPYAIVLAAWLRARREG